jgi:hypothetical protein
MMSSAEVAILIKVADLAKRCGFRASDAEGFLSFVDENKDPDGNGYYILDFGSTPVGQEAHEKKARFLELLGIKGSATMKGELADFEDTLDRALSLAPRERAR